MSDYSKMKNADLEALLKSRGLPGGGKKADMVERLIKDDDAKAVKPSESTTLHPEDQIDWDDDDEASAAKDTATDTSKTPADAPAAAAEAAGGEGPVGNPQSVPNQQVAVDPSKTDDLSVKQPLEQKAEVAKDDEKVEEPVKDYSSGLKASTLDEEIEKRKARAKKFGLDIENDEGLKKLERMKKFGENGPPKGLDEALPNTEKRKRGREGGDDNSRHKRRGGGRPDGGRRGGGNRGGDSRRDNRENNTRRSNNSGPSWMSEADRKKAEARKNRFGGGTAA